MDSEEGWGEEEDDEEVAFLEGGDGVEAGAGTEEEDDDDDDDVVFFSRFGSTWRRMNCFSSVGLASPAFASPRRR